MMKPTIANLARLAPLMALCSCAAPKATVAEQAPVPTKEAPVEPAIAEPAIPSRPDDGIRLPDMVTLPDDAEFRATNPSLPSSEPGAGAVIARPPTEPPSRRKPKHGE